MIQKYKKSSMRSNHPTPSTSTYRYRSLLSVDKTCSLVQNGTTVPVPYRSTFAILTSTTVLYLPYRYRSRSSRSTGTVRTPIHVWLLRVPSSHSPIPNRSCSLFFFLLSVCCCDTRRINLPNNQHGRKEPSQTEQ